MKISSNNFEDTKRIPSKFTCEGLNINPHLKFEEVPINTKSLALVVIDPDSPTGEFTHWIIWNIDPTTTEINEGEIPLNSVQGINDSKKVGYIGPCPPSGTHRYYFRLYALASKLNLKEGESRASFLKEINNLIIDKAEFCGIYSKDRFIPVV